jgi:predicted dithiol-disulfide oxidoreductase (DUF899 family)
MDDCCTHVSETAAGTELDRIEREIAALKVAAAECRRRLPREEVRGFVFRDASGAEVALSELFGDHDALIVVHNMGRSCRYCTMWADGLNGLVPYLTTRAAFVVASPDPPVVQRDVAAARGWHFRMVSAAGTDFFKAMGFVDADGYMPGASVFQRGPRGGVSRVSRVEFGPGDDFCPVWHFLDLLPEGIDGWEPRS